METVFPFVEIPEGFRAIAGSREEGTRIFRAEGDPLRMRAWFDALCSEIGPCVSPGDAAVYVGVSRAGVYKRIKTGGLTAFCFRIVGEKKTLFGGARKLKEFPIVYVPVAECQAWAAELERRFARIERMRLWTAEFGAAGARAPRDRVEKTRTQSDRKVEAAEPETDEPATRPERLATRPQRYAERGGQGEPELSAEEERSSRDDWSNW